MNAAPQPQGAGVEHDDLVEVTPGDRSLDEGPEEQLMMLGRMMGQVPADVIPGLRRDRDPALVAALAPADPHQAVRKVAGEEPAELAGTKSGGRVGSAFQGSHLLLQDPTTTTLTNPLTCSPEAHRQGSVQ